MHLGKQFRVLIEIFKDVSHLLGMKQNGRWNGHMTLTITLGEKGNTTPSNSLSIQKSAAYDKTKVLDFKNVT